MRNVIGIGLAAVSLAFAASAETQHGVAVYPGAKADTEMAAQLKKAMKIEAKTYRTSDPVEKVAQFYRDQKLKQMPGADAKQAGFMAPGVHVTIQNPWMDMKTGKIVNETLVSIVKQ